MPGCVLSATGSDFDVGAFLKSSRWREFAFMYVRGDPTASKSCPVQRNSGLSLEISDLEECSLEQQIRDALVFLTKERGEIQRLINYPGVDSLGLRFGIFWFRDTLCQFHTLSPEFLRLAGELGIEVTFCIYGTSDSAGEVPAVAGKAPNRRSARQARGRTRRKSGKR